MKNMNTTLEIPEGTNALRGERIIKDGNMKKLLKIKAGGITRYLDVNIIERIVFTGDKEISIAERELYKKSTNITVFRNVENVDEIIEQLEALVPRAPLFLVKGDPDDYDAGTVTTLTFTDPLRAKFAIYSDDMAFALWELTHNTRRQVKWIIDADENNELNEYDILDKVFEKIYDLMHEHGIHDLIENIP